MSSKRYFNVTSATQRNSNSMASNAFFAKVKAKLFHLYRERPCFYYLPNTSSEITMFRYEEFLTRLRTIMIPINPIAFEYIEKVFMKISNFSFKQCLIFHLLHLHASLSTLPLKEELLENFKSNLEMMLSKVKNYITGDNYSKMFNLEGFDTYCMIEILYVSIGTFLQMFISESTIFNPLIGDVGQLEDDLTNLFIIYQLRKFLDEIILTINELNDNLRCKEFLLKEVIFDKQLFDITKFKWFLQYHRIYTYVLFLIKKYSLYPSMNRFKENFDMETLNQLSKNLFCVMEANVILCYKNHKEEYKTKLLIHESFETFIMLSLYKTDLYTWLKFLREDSFFDCINCYPSQQKFYSKFFNKVLDILCSKLKTLMDNIERTKRDRSKIGEVDINIPLLKEYLQSLKGFITCQLISSFTNDNVYDSSRNSWILIFFDLFSLSESLLAFSYLVNKYNKSINGLLPMTKDSLILQLFTHLTQSLNEKFSLVIPMKLYVYKQTILNNILIVFDYFLNQYAGSVGHIVSQLKTSPLYDTLINNLIQLSNQQSFLVFYFSNRILKALTKESYKQRLRIYGLIKYPFDYNTIEEELKLVKSTSPSLFYSNNQLSISLLTEENKENSFLLSNCTNRSTLLAVENPESVIQSKDMAPSSTSFDISQIKDNYNLDELCNVFGETIVWSKRDRRVHLVSTSKEPIILLQLGNGNTASNNNNNAITNKETIPQTNTILSHIHLDLNQRDSIMNYVYCEMHQDEVTNTEYLNYFNTIKYYDSENRINYFDFLDKIDILLT